MGLVFSSSPASEAHRKGSRGTIRIFQDSTKSGQARAGVTPVWWIQGIGWDVYYGGAISNFIDHWMPRKVIGADELQQKAPGILREKMVEMVSRGGVFDKETLDEFLSGLPRGKRKDITRLQEATELLYRLHSPQHFT